MPSHEPSDCFVPKQPSGTERPCNHALLKRIRTGTVGCIRIGYLIVKVAIDPNDIVHRPTDRSICPFLFDTSGYSDTRPGASSVFYVWWRNENDLARVEDSGRMHMTPVGGLGHVAKLSKKIFVVSWVSPGPVYVNVNGAGNQIFSIFRVIRIHRVNDLGEIVFRLCLSGLVLNCFECGEEQAD